MNFTPSELRAKIEENQDLLALRESESRPGLFVMKYKKKVFFDNLWNDFLEEARGLVIDADYNIVQRPFLKIYNYGVEERAPKFAPDEMVSVFRKVNGFMLAATYDEKFGIVVSTTGSLDSDFVKLGQKYITKELEMVLSVVQNRDYTFLFECCDPSDPHIVQEDVGLYVLGARNKKTGELVTDFVEKGSLMFVKTPEHFMSSVSYMQQTAKYVKHEGFVFYSKDGRAAKIKTPHYLTKKALMRSNFDKIMNRDAKMYLDEEFYPLIDKIKTVDAEIFKGLDEMQRRAYIEEYFLTN